MDTPILSSLLHASEAQRIAEIIANFQEAVEKKHIWNTDFQTGKDWLSRRCEQAVDKLKDRHRTGEHPAWGDTDPRWQTIYTTSFLNYPGLVKRLQKYKDDAAVVPYLPLFTEIAQIAELVKSVKPFIEKGRKPNPNVKPIDLTNTGTCAICTNLQKLNDEQKMVHHGYQISDGFGHYFGFRSGTCFGVNRQPYELSNEANIAYKAVLEQNLVNVQERLSGLNSGAITEIPRLEHEHRGFGQNKQVLVTYKQGEPKWKDVLEREIRDVEYAIRMIKIEIEMQDTRIKQWVLKPLPHGLKIS